MKATRKTEFPSLAPGRFVEHHSDGAGNSAVPPSMKTASNTSPGLISITVSPLLFRANEKPA
ncbi:MAG: hypothetical protein E4G96_11120 [Chrysiogenales bacterium]|nr:MAG: hypothetical protein E4G96_11120 [Chrysiogenales bacterium]